MAGTLIIIIDLYDQ